MRPFPILFSVICLVASGISSCKKECNTAAPVISVTSPAQGGLIQLPDSIHIEGNVSDDVWLNSLSVTIYGPTEDTVFISHPQVYGQKEFSFTYHYFTGATGNFRLQVAAEDNDGLKAEKELTFTVQP